MSEALSFTEIDRLDVDMLPARTVLSCFGGGFGGDNGGDTNFNVNANENTNTNTATATATATLLPDGGLLAGLLG